MGLKKVTSTGSHRRVIALGVLLEYYRYYSKRTYKQLATEMHIPVHALNAIIKGRRTNSEYYRLAVVWVLTHSIIV